KAPADAPIGQKTAFSAACTAAGQGSASAAGLRAAAFRRRPRARLHLRLQPPGPRHRHLVERPATGRRKVQRSPDPAKLAGRHLRQPRQGRRMNLHAIRAIYLFEMARSWRTLSQSLLAPVISTSLYFVVFGAAIGNRIN